MFFETYTEFIEAIYCVKYSKLKKEEKNLKYNEIYKEYREYGIYNKDFEEIYWDIVNGVEKEVSKENLESLTIYNGLLLSLKQLLKLKIKIHYLDNSPYVESMYSLVEEKGRYHCLQCDNKRQKTFFTYTYKNEKVTYCKRCIEYGRSDTRLAKFHINIPRVNDFNIEKPNVLLSVEQKRASDKLIENFKIRKDSLVWAVCGAGKTEIVYEIIYKALKENKTICFAIPRKDVVKELIGRFQRDFKNVKINYLYGEEKVLLNSNFYIMTTHQLVKYYNYFDVAIIDEVDAFPYYGDELLEEGVLTALKKESFLAFLSATPSQRIKKAVKEIIKIPIRYHGCLLPIPKIKIDNKEVFTFDKFSNQLKNYLKDSLEKRRKVLIFVPSIRMCSNMENYLNKLLVDKSIRINSVHSEDEKREEKIKKFYENKYDILVTTTVLERGVTFDYLDVVVFDASHTHFTKEALIQIAGRVGRKDYDYHGNIIFLAKEKTRQQKLAIKEIEYMNLLAEQRGLVKNRE